MVLCDVQTWHSGLYSSAFLIHSLATEVTSQSGSNESSVCQASKDVSDSPAGQILVSEVKYD